MHLLAATLQLGKFGASSERHGIERVRPKNVSIADARVISGLSRSELYRRLAAGKIHAVKGGSRTLIVFDSLISHLNSLPAAIFRAICSKGGVAP